MYLFIVIFALASLVQDQKIKEIISKHYNKTRRNFYNRLKKETKQESEIKEKTKSEQPFFGER